VLLDRTLEILEQTGPIDNNELKDAWTEVFDVLVRQTPRSPDLVEYIYDRILDRVTKMFAYKEPQPQRIRACKMLLRILSMGFEEEETKEHRSLLGKTYNMCTDMDWRV